MMLKQKIKPFWIDQQKRILKNNKEKLKYISHELGETFSPLIIKFKKIPHDRFNFFEDMDRINKKFKPIADSINSGVYRRTNAIRRSRIREALDISVFDEEKQLIKCFYEECPTNFHVDHIIPLSKGGKHSLKNLQWLQSHVNLKKNDIVVEPLTEYPHCRIDISKIFDSKEGDFFRNYSTTQEQ